MDLGRGSWFDRAVSTGSETIQSAPDGSSLDPTEALRHERRVSAALREVGVALGTTFDLDDLLELILSKLTDLVASDRPGHHARGAFARRARSVCRRV